MDDGRFSRLCFWVGFFLIGYCMTVGFAGLMFNCVLPFVQQVTEQVGG